MEAASLLQLIQKGETSTCQLKADVRNATSLAQELVAFANSEGGKLLIGVDDKTGALTGLSFQDIQRINSLLTTAAHEHSKSPITIRTETVAIEGKNVIVVDVPEGTDKPYMDKNGLTFVKNGADKRKVTSKEELRRLLQSSGNLSAEEEVLAHTNFRKHFDKDRFSAFYEARYHSLPDWDELPRLLENLRLAKGEHLTRAGALLFGLDVRHLLPSCYISAVWFEGNELSGSSYRSSDNLYGTLASQYRRGMEFVMAKLEKRQNGQDFNSLGEPEIPEVVIRELLINALLHRNYFIRDSIKLFVFDNRIEINSPGTLPNHLTETEIRLGISRQRNVLLSNFALEVLPYRAIGSGIVRALRAYPHIAFQNDKAAETFRVTILRS